MIFTLEALQAAHGDALLLHYGHPDAPRLMIIDGGPAGIYKNSLRPRLDELRGGEDSDEVLPVKLMMVSHLDDDHITGILDLTNIIIQQKDDQQFVPYQLSSLWLNSFDDVISKKVKPLMAAFETNDQHLRRSATAAVASVPQGQKLRDNANRLKLRVNAPFGTNVMAKSDGASTANFDNLLTLTVVGPNEELLDALEKKWDQIIQKKGTAKDAEVNASVVEYVDRSVYNLSSIVVLAVCDGNKMLLTGDARGDYIIEGLETAGLLEGGSIHVNLLKLPHHGSVRDINGDFFRQITADHYVISANGKYDNPDVETLQLLTDARGNAEYSVHLTNEIEWVTKFFEKDRKKNRRYEVLVREDTALSIKVDLGEPLSR